MHIGYRDIKDVITGAASRFQEGDFMEGNGLLPCLERYQLFGNVVEWSIYRPGNGDVARVLGGPNRLDKPLTAFATATATETVLSTVTRSSTTSFPVSVSWVTVYSTQTVVPLRARPTKYENVIPNVIH